MREIKFRRFYVCEECGDCIKDSPLKCRAKSLCVECYAELICGLITPQPFNIGQNPCGNGWGDDMAFDIAVKEYERDKGERQ